MSLKNIKGVTSALTLGFQPYSDFSGLEMPIVMKPSEEMALVKSSQESIGNMSFSKVCNLYPMKFENPDIQRESVRDNIPMKFLINPK
jgi:hypothetical protein